MYNKIWSASFFAFIITAALSACNQTSQKEDEIFSHGQTISNGIFKRTTTRSFSQDPVTEEQTDLLIKAAFAAPTGGDQHSCEFIIITDRAVMADLKKGNPYSAALDTAPLVIVIAVNEETAVYPELLEFDSGLASQSILVQASESGLSSVPMSIAPQKERIQGVSETLGLPEHVIPQIMIAIGYPAEDAISSASVNFYDKSRVHYNGF